MAIVFPLEHLQAKERFDYWQDVVCSTFAPTTNHRLTDEPFDGSLDVTFKGDVSYSRIRSLPIKYERGRQDDGNDHFFVTLTLCPDAYLSQSGRTSRQRPGNIVLFDSAQPYICTLPQGDDQIVLAIPRQRLLRHIPHYEQFLSRTLDNQSPLGNLARSMLLEMWGAHAQSGVVDERLNGALLDVLASAFEAAYGSTLIDTTRRRDDRLERAQSLIEKHQPNRMVILGGDCLVDLAPFAYLNELYEGELADTSEPVLKWLKETGAKHLAIHLDLDVLDPSAFRSLLFANPNAPEGAFEGIAQGKMTIEQVMRLLSDVAKAVDVVGLGVTEHLPWDSLALKNMLANLPLLGNTTND